MQAQGSRGVVQHLESCTALWATRASGLFSQAQTGTWKATLLLWSPGDLLAVQTGQTGGLWEHPLMPRRPGPSLLR